MGYNLYTFSLILILKMFYPKCLSALLGKLKEYGNVLETYSFESLNALLLNAYDSSLSVWSDSVNAVREIVLLALDGNRVSVEFGYEPGISLAIFFALTLFICLSVSSSNGFNNNNNEDK